MFRTKKRSELLSDDEDVGYAIKQSSGRCYQISNFMLLLSLASLLIYAITAQNAFGISKTGPAGINGRNGINGKDGKDGVNGVDGAAGIQGIQGTQGVQGLQGLPGATGPSMIPPSNMFSVGLHTTSMYACRGNGTGICVSPIYDRGLNDGATDWPNPGMIGDFYTTQTYLYAGNYVITIGAQYSHLNGIVDVYIDNVNTSSLDIYKADPPQFFVKTTTGTLGALTSTSPITIATSGFHRVDLRADRKNALADGYYLQVDFVTLFKV